MFGAIGETGLNQALTKRLMAPGGAVAPSIAPELFPVIVLENDRPEYKYLASERMGSTQGAFVAGVAAQRSRLRFRNPADSNTLVVFELLTAVVTTTDSIVFTISASTDLANLVDTAALDTRFANPPLIGRRTILVVSQESTAAAPANPVEAFRALQQASGVRYELTKPIILTPGFALDISPASDNISMGAAGIWRERAMQPTER